MTKRRRRRPHGHGTVYERGPGNWWVSWREGGQIRYAHGYPTRELAERVLTKVIGDIAARRDGIRPDPRGLPTLENLSVDWLKRRKLTHRSARDDGYRWKNHLGPFFGGMRTSEVDVASLRRFIETARAKGLSSNTVGNCVRCLSTFFTDLVERGLATANPVRALPRSTRRLYRPSHDPKTTPFLKTMGDVRRVYLALGEPASVAFAVGAFAGLRTGEVLGLEWRDVDLETRRIHVERQVNDGKIGPLKDDDSRVVPIQEALLPILREWHVRTGGKGLLFRPASKRGGKPGRPPRFVRPNTLWKHLGKALKECGLPEELTWYHCTRHTFASQWVLAGGSIVRLSKIMGHSSVDVTERYAHLQPDSFREAEFNMLAADLSRPGGKLVPFQAPAETLADDYAATTREEDPDAEAG